MDDFTPHHAPGIGARQTGGKAAVFQNGIAVFAALLHEIGFTAPLTAHHLVIAFPDVRVFGVQVRPALRPFKDDLIVIIMHITQRIDGAYRFRLTFRLLLMKLHFIRLQAAIPLHNVHVAGKNGIVRVVTFSVIGIDSNRQIVGIAFYQRTIVARHAQHTL